MTPTISNVYFELWVWPISTLLTLKGCDLWPILQPATRWQSIRFWFHSWGAVMTSIFIISELFFFLTGCYWFPWCCWQSWTSRPLCKSCYNVLSSYCSCDRAQCPGCSSVWYSPHRATLDLLDPLDLVAKRDPKETVVRLDLLVALVSWVLLDPQELLERRVALVPKVLL